MSIEVMQRVWQHSKCKGTALLLLLAIADNCNKDAEGWPGIAYLAEKTRMSGRQIQRLVQYVESTKELAVEWNAGRGNANLYFVLTGMPEAEAELIRQRVEANNAARAEALQIKGDKLSPPAPDTKGDNLSPFPEPNGDISAAPQTPNGDISARKGDRFDVKGDIAMSPEPLNLLTKPEPSGTDCGSAQISLPTHPETGKQVIPKPAEAWAYVRGQLEAEMRPGEYRAWIAPLKPVGYSGSTFQVSAVNSYARDWVTTRLGKRICGLLTCVYGSQVQLHLAVEEAHRA